MDGKTKVTKEVLCEESRFILANVMAESKYGKQNTFDDIRRVCEGAVSIPFSDYVQFLASAGYLRQDRSSETLEITELGEEIVNGGSLTELTAAAVSHFKSMRAGRRRKEGSGSGHLPAPDLARGGRPGSHRMSGEVLDSRYEKLASIGSGGIGSVFRARQVPLDRQVALKEIRDLFSFFAEEQRPEIIRRFTEVVRAHSKLAHPNILPIHDVNLDREYPYVVSELCPNGSVRRLISDAETVPVGLTIKYLVQTLHAFSAAHRADVVHRGLKPENMLIDAYGNLKVSDFGFARIVERDQKVIRQVYVGMGQVGYMAPELFTDPGAAGPQADIYALGIIFYEMLTRKLPGRRSPMPSEIDPKLPKGIDDIFDLMTRDARDERYASVDDILSDFDRIEGLDAVLDAQTQVIVAENPLEKVVFKEEEPPAPAAEATAAAEPAAESTAEGPPADTGATTDEEQPVEDGLGSDKSSGKYRPYSYQQRNRK